MTVETIKDGVVVSLAYTMTVDGVMIEDATADEPLDYLHGYDNIVPGLENLLAGKKAGDKFEAVIAPEDGYGEYDEEDTTVVARGDIPDADELEEGMVVVLEDEDGDFFEAIIVEMSDE